MELVRHIVISGQIIIMPTLGLPVAIISYPAPLSSERIKRFAVYCTDIDWAKMNCSSACKVLNLFNIFKHLRIGNHNKYMRIYMQFA